MFNKVSRNQYEKMEVAKEKTTDKGDVRFSRANVRKWDEDFLNTTIHSNLTKMRGKKTETPGVYEGGHPSYHPAKYEGSLFDAMVLVDDLLKTDKIKQLKKDHPDALVVAPHAQESGNNAIPLMMAMRFEQYGIKREDSIIQNNKVSRTVKDAVLRLVIRPSFEGNVTPGQEYILVDDAAGQGGTFSGLRHYIENNGGKVVATSALAQGMFSAKLSINEKTKEKLVEKFGEDNLVDFLLGHNIAGKIDALTEKEARYILGNSSLAGLEAKIFEAAEAEGISPERWGYQTRDEVKRLRLKKSSLPATRKSTSTKPLSNPANLQAELSDKNNLGKSGLRNLIRKGLLNLVSNQEAQAVLERVLGARFSMALLHGSGVSGIDQFKTDKSGTGAGLNSYGHGIYLTDSKAVARYYAEHESGKRDGSGAAPKRKAGQRNIYKADVSGKDFVHWDNITQAQKDKLAAEANKNHLEMADTIGFFLDTYEDGGNAYRNISYVLGGDSKASQFFLDAGIDGIQYPVATMTGGNQKGTNYVVFDQASINITDSIRYSSPAGESMPIERASNFRLVDSGKTRDIFRGETKSGHPAYSNGIFVRKFPVVKSTVSKKNAKQPLQ